MKFKNIYFLAVGVLALASCAEDTTDPVLELRQAATLNAVTPADITITKDNSTAQFPDITWEKANYGSGAVVNYTVTLTNNSSQKSVVIGETGNTKLSFTNAEMNTILGLSRTGLRLHRIAEVNGFRRVSERGYEHRGVQGYALRPERG